MKYAKYAAVALAPIVLIVGLWLAVRGSGGARLSSSVMCVDVMSGEIVHISRDKLTGVPARNSAGERVVFPVETASGGVIKIPDHYRDGVEMLKDDPRLKIDLATMTIKR